MLDECYLVKTIDVVLKCDDNNSSNNTFKTSIKTITITTMPEKRLSRLLATSIIHTCSRIIIISHCFFFSFLINNQSLFHRVIQRGTTSIRSHVRFKSTVHLTVILRRETNNQQKFKKVDPIESHSHCISRPLNVFTDAIVSTSLYIIQRAQIFLFWKICVRFFIFYFQEGGGTKGVAQLQDNKLDHIVLDYNNVTQQQVQLIFG